MPTATSARGGSTAAWPWRGSRCRPGPGRRYKMPSAAPARFTASSASPHRSPTRHASTRGVGVGPRTTYPRRTATPSSIARQVRGRPTLPEGYPREEEGICGPQFPMLIHLNRTRDYSLLEDHSPGAPQDWPLDDQFCWAKGTEDGKAGTGTRRSAAVVAQPRPRSRDDEDENGADGRGRHCRARSRSAWPGGTLGCRSAEVAPGPHHGGSSGGEA